MKYFLIPALLLCSGCICLNRDHRRLLEEQKDKPPVTDTRGVKDKIDETKTELTKVGESSQGIGKAVDRAQDLAERADNVLEEMQKQEKQ